MSIGTEIAYVITVTKTSVKPSANWYIGLNNQNIGASTDVAFISSCKEM
ncbi:MAG: hypothetical protein KME29_26500 [Calothrix sp. FI2-JRJ7]|nr:hypothetical protein [Calothrix sp. FI2-JRJ7]